MKLLMWMYWLIIQEKQSFDQGNKYTSNRFKRSVLPNSILTAFLNPVCGLSMEAALVILAKPIIYCSETLVHNSNSFDVWNYILGSGMQKVQGNATYYLY